MLICASCGRENPAGASFCNGCAAPLGQVPQSGAQRKVVTCLFCDVAGSTALGEQADPEVLRVLLSRYFERMKEIVQHHGGVVEKFIGDAVMAVFGLPAAHEDDALRAVRAAAAMRTALADLGVAGRIGVNTGEVVAGTEERLATGDAVNVAARLEQAAEPGEILLGETTFRLARHAVEADAVEPLVLKGKQARVPAWRLQSVSGEAAERPPGSPLVGREQELRALAQAWEGVRAEQRCELVTIVGAAGVGKSRLVAELRGRIDATVVRGRCLSYGTGITYWPVVEVLKQLEPRLPGLEVDPAVRGALDDLLANEGEASTDEIAWAFRKLLEAAAHERPLVAVFDDIQWGEEAFLDLLEHVAYLATEAPLLLLCMARPDLLDRRAGWGGVLRLEPLPPEEADRLLGLLLGEGGVAAAVRDRVVAGAGGNPLFLEELVAMALQSGDGALAVPPTIQALLAARLDQLDSAERAVLERAAVEGEVFHRGAVQALGPGESRLTTRLTALVRKELVRPDKPQLAGEDAFRFRHLLIRDAAYEGLAKATRADLHARFAEWLEERWPDLVELDEVLGYHLEKAFRYGVELGVSDPTTRALAERAAERLAAAGRRASRRWDVRAAIGLVERAASLLAPDDPRRTRLLVELGRDLLVAKELSRAEAVLSEAMDAAARGGDSQAAAHARVAALSLRVRRAEKGALDEVVEEAGRAIRTFEELGDDAGLAQAWLLRGIAAHGSEMATCQAALARALTHAGKAGDAKEEAAIRIMRGLASLDGPAPLGEVVSLQQENLAWARTNRSLRLKAASLVLGGRLHALQGDFDQGRALIARGRELFGELGVTVGLAAVTFWSGEVEELAGDLPAAEREFRSSFELNESRGDGAAVGSAAYFLARLADLQGRREEAEKLVEICEKRAEAAGDDVLLQVDCRCGRARVLARQGKREAAVRLTGEAIALLPPRDVILDRGFLLIDLAQILALAGEADQAAALAEEALQLYEQKGSVVPARKARALLADLRETASVA